MLRRAAGATILALALLALCAPAASARGIFGVINQAPLGTDDVPALQGAKPATVRALVLWNYVQPSAGRCTAGGIYDPGTHPGANNCSWETIDGIAGAAAGAGVKMLPFLFGMPDWLDSARRTTRRYVWAPPLYSASDRRAWRQFVNAFVARYGRGGTFWQEPVLMPRRPVTHVQVWNEPTSPAYFAPRPNVRRYVQLLRITNATLRRADPRIKVVLAGVFGTPRATGGGIDMPKFLRKLYKLRAGRFFDVAALHPYAPNARGVRLQIQAARDLMEDGGDRRTKLWITELGWASKGPKGHTLTSTPRGQARLLRRAFAMLMRKRRSWKIAGVNWFSWRDVPPSGSSCAACPWSGLLRRDGTPKPAYRAFQRFTG